jgi:hypothetical protein
MGPEKKNKLSLFPPFPSARCNLKQFHLIYDKKFKPLKSSEEK